MMEDESFVRYKMAHKCIDNDLFDDVRRRYYREICDDADSISFEEPDGHTDFELLSRWILQAQDGQITQSDFNKLHHCLSTDPEALSYYVDFSWLGAALHHIYSIKPPILTAG
jgi:hypothetical protein